MSTAPLASPSAQPKKSSKRIVAIVIGVLILSGLMLWGAISLATGHDWALGVGAQQSTTKLATVQRAVADTPDVLFVGVKNGNTSGTPFGHSIRVIVFFDEAKVPSDNKKAVNELTGAVEDNMYRAKVADEYTVFYIPAKAGDTFDSESLLRTTDAVVTNKFKVR